MVNDIMSPQRVRSNTKKSKPSKPKEVPFVPPEKVAEIEDSTKPQLLISRHKKNWQKLGKKQKLIIGGAGLLLLIAAPIGGYFLFLKPSPSKPTPVITEEKAVEPPKPTTEASLLTGVQVPIGSNQTPVTGVIIENSPDARPQAGLKDAGVVIEAIAEGGITRFLAIFQDTKPDYVGPIRSVRPYFLQWIQGFDAAIAHSGGSPEALSMIRAGGIKDLDHAYNAATYQRVSGRYAPHNVYTSLDKLLSLSASKGFGPSSFTPFGRKTEAPLPVPTAKTIDFAISSALYNVHYDYDATSNSYLRSEGGRSHTDDKSGQQIKPKVVIAMVVPKGIAADRVHTTYNVVGSGTAYFYQDGHVTQGNWSKASVKENLTFTDGAGAPLTLNAGQTWISIVNATNQIRSAP